MHSNSFVASTVEYVVIQQAQISYCVPFNHSVQVQYEFKIEILGQNLVYGEDLIQKFGKTITFTEALEDTSFKVSFFHQCSDQ